MTSLVAECPTAATHKLATSALVLVCGVVCVVCVVCDLLALLAYKRATTTVNTMRLLLVSCVVVWLRVRERARARANERARESERERARAREREGESERKRESESERARKRVTKREEIYWLRTRRRHYTDESKSFS